MIKLSLKMLLVASLLLLQAVNAQTQKIQTEWCNDYQIAIGFDALALCKDLACGKCASCKGGWISRGWISSQDIKDANIQTNEEKRKFFCMTFLVWLIPLILGLVVFVGGGICCYRCQKARRNKVNAQLNKTAMITEAGNII